MTNQQTAEISINTAPSLIRKAAARSYDAVWKAGGAIYDLYSSQECENFSNAAGYEAK